MTKQDGASAADDDPEITFRRGCSNNPTVSPYPSVISPQHFDAPAYVKTRTGKITCCCLYTFMLTTGTTRGKHGLSDKYLYSCAHQTLFDEHRQFNICGRRDLSRKETLWFDHFINELVFIWTKKKLVIRFTICWNDLKMSIPMSSKNLLSHPCRKSFFIFFMDYTKFDQRYFKSTL